MNQSKKPDLPSKVQDTQTDMRHVYSQKLQEEILKTVEKYGKNLDPPTIVQCLGLTASFMATSIGINESEFVDAMRGYVRQVRSIMNLPLAEPEVIEEKKIILPS